MKYLLLVAVVSLACASITNTTNFYKTETALPSTFQSYSGFEDIDWYLPNSTSLYYSLYQKVGSSWSWDDKNIPLIIWFSAKPGSSAQLGCFNEIGPFAVSGQEGNWKVSKRQLGWNFFGHVMCVDHPGKVGFSISDSTPTSSKEASVHFINFLSNFYKNNAKLGLSKNPLYLGGENYGGRLALVSAEAIISNSSVAFNLKGVILGNTWIDPSFQIANYHSFLRTVGVCARQSPTSFMQNEAMMLVKRGENALDYLQWLTESEEVREMVYNGMNVANYRQYDDGNINKQYAKYLESKKKNLGVPDNNSFVEWNQTIWKSFGDDYGLSFRKDLARILDASIKVLVYQGQNDISVNTAGVISVLSTVEWKGLKKWRESVKRVWRQIEGANLGWFKQSENLNLVLVRNAGQFVFADEPRVGWSMLNNYFMKGWQ